MQLPMAMFVPGPMEMLIVGLMCVMPIALAVMIALFVINKSRTPTSPSRQKPQQNHHQSPPRSRDCPACGQPLAAGARECFACGRPIDDPGTSG